MDFLIVYLTISRKITKIEITLSFNKSNRIPSLWAMIILFYQCNWLIGSTGVKWGDGEKTLNEVSLYWNYCKKLNFSHLTIEPHVTCCFILKKMKKE